MRCALCAPVQVVIMYVRTLDSKQIECKTEYVHRNDCRANDRAAELRAHNKTSRMGFG